MKLISIDDVVNNGSPIGAGLKFIFRNKKNLQILDVGACTGEDSIIYANLFPNSKIIAFEPLPGNLAMMKEHIRKFQKETLIRTENFALSDEEGDHLFYVSGGSLYNKENSEFTTIIPKEWNKSSSLLKPGKQLEKEFPWLTFPDCIHVKARRLDNYLKENGITQVHFMHIDVQGAELKVLMGMGEMLKKVKAIWLEVENCELYENQPLKHDIEDYLFKFKFYLAKDTSKGKTAGDCLFIYGLMPFLYFKLFQIVGLIPKVINRVRLIIKTSV